MFFAAFNHKHNAFLSLKQLGHWREIVKCLVNVWVVFFGCTDLENKILPAQFLLHRAEECKDLVIQRLKQQVVFGLHISEWLQLAVKHFDGWSEIVVVHFDSLTGHFQLHLQQCLLFDLKSHQLLLDLRIHFSFKFQQVFTQWNQLVIGRNHVELSFYLTEGLKCWNMILTPRFELFWCRAVRHCDIRSWPMCHYCNF